MTMPGMKLTGLTSWVLCSIRLWRCEIFLWGVDRELRCGVVKLLRIFGENLVQVISNEIFDIEGIVGGDDF